MQYLGLTLPYEFKDVVKVIRTHKISHKGENSARANPANIYMFKVNNRNTRKRC